MSLATHISSNFKTLQTAAGVEIRYTRGERSVLVRAVPGETNFVRSDGEGYMESSISRDFMFPAADLGIGGTPVLPERGDVITETVGGVETTRPVTPASGDRVFRYCDPYHQVLRVHTRETA